MTKTVERPDDRKFDRTSLRASSHGYRVHRDYAAHYFRWGWALRKTAEPGVGLPGKRVLDVGCGVDLPLINVASFGSFLPGYYVGVDLNKLPELTPGRRKWATLHGETDFTNPFIRQALWAQHGSEPFDVVVCFEVLEHMQPADATELLRGMGEFVAPSGHILISTPVFDGKHHAHNHVHELGVAELAELISAAGLRVERRFGTFASAQDARVGMAEWLAKHGLDQATWDALYAGLKEFHSSEVLATFVAPVIPDHSRNNAWMLRRADA